MELINSDGQMYVYSSSYVTKHFTSIFYLMINYEFPMFKIKSELNTSSNKIANKLIVKERNST